MIISPGSMWKRWSTQQERGERTVGTWCANVGKNYEGGGSGCVVAVQDTEKASERAVFMCVTPTQEVTNTTPSALILASHVHVHKTYRIEADRSPGDCRTPGERSTSSGKSIELLG